METTKLVLDTTCGARMMWFDKKNPHALFVDNRAIDPTTVGLGRNARTFEVSPDQVVDFRKMPFDDETFYLTVFDPPHLIRAGGKSYMAAKYGKLDKHTWQEDLRAGFEQCWRVTKINGTIIFKWNEYQVPVHKVLEAIGRKPLFGHISNRSGHTIWMCFLKTKEEL